MPFAVFPAKGKKLKDLKLFTGRRYWFESRQQTTEANSMLSNLLF